MQYTHLRYHQAMRRADDDSHAVVDVARLVVYELSRSMLLRRGLPVTRGALYTVITRVETLTAGKRHTRLPPHKILSSLITTA